MLIVFFHFFYKWWARWGAHTNKAFSFDFYCPKRSQEVLVVWEWAVLRHMAVFIKRAFVGSFVCIFKHKSPFAGFYVVRNLTAYKRSVEVFQRYKMPCKGYYGRCRNCWTDRCQSTTVTLEPWSDSEGCSNSRCSFFKRNKNAEAGKSTLETYAAIMAALDLKDQLLGAFPDYGVSPIQLLKTKGTQRQRASGKTVVNASQKAELDW